MTHILVTHAEGLGFPGYIKSIKKIKDIPIIVSGVSHERKNVGFHFVDNAYLTSSVNDKNYVNDLSRICKDNKIDILIPIDRKEIPFILKHKDKFDKTQIMASTLESFTTANDKHKILKICERIGIPVPKYYPVTNFSDFQKALKKLDYPKQKICFKPSVSSGSRGFRIVSSNNSDRIKNFFNQHIGLNITVEEFKSIVAKKEFPELLVMEYLPGEEYSIDVLADKGKSLIIVPRVREKTIIGASFTGKTIKHKEIIEYVKILTQFLKLDNIVGMQFKLDSNKVPKIIEVNPRVHGGLIISILSGVNFFELAIKKMLNIPFKIPPVKWGTRTFRFIDDFKLYDKT